MPYWGPGIVNTKCPFYQRENKLSIVCEGFTPNTNQITKFETEGEKRRFQEKNCYYYPNQCQIRLAKEKDYDGTKKC